MPDPQERAQHREQWQCVDKLEAIIGAAQATISAADAFISSLDPGALELGSLGLLEKWKAAVTEYRSLAGAMQHAD